MSAPSGQARSGTGVAPLVVLPTTLAAGTLLLAVALRQDHQDGTWLLVALLATCVWGVGGLLSGPVQVGRLRRPGRPGPGGPPLVAPVVVGLALLAVSLAGSVLLAHLPGVGDSIDVVVTRSTSQPWWLLVPVLLVGGAAEELMFRGALYDALARWRPVLTTALVYTLATATAGYPVLALGALLLGLVTGVQRRVSGGVLAPVLTHVTWSVGMALLLPPLIGLLG